MPKNPYADLLVAAPPTQMEYTRLGDSGLKVSKIILGAMSYGSKQWADWVLEEEEALPLLEHAYKVGMDLLNIPEDQKIEKTVFVKAPRALAYGNVVKVIDAIKGAGASPVGLQVDDLP